MQHPSLQLLIFFLNMYMKYQKPTAKVNVLCYLRLDFPADKMRAPEQPQSEL